MKIIKFGQLNMAVNTNKKTLKNKNGKIINLPKRMGSYGTPNNMTMIQNHGSMDCMVVRIRNIKLEN